MLAISLANLLLLTSSVDVYAERIHACAFLATCSLAALLPPTFTSLDAVCSLRLS
jgi:hypothetical protein